MFKQFNHKHLQKNLQNTKTIITNLTQLKTETFYVKQSETALVFAKIINTTFNIIKRKK